MTRQAQIERDTRETSIELSLNLDQAGDANHPEISTGVGFFDHMLEHVAKHGQFDLKVKAKGDTHVDDHHTVEDVGIVLGQALDQALGDKKGIERYGFASVPMEESLARVSVDLSGRPALVFLVDFTNPDGKIGDFDNQLVREFFNAVVNNGKFNLHIEAPPGEIPGNDHHIAEAAFKAFARALRQAVAITGDQVPSTKGVL